MPHQPVAGGRYIHEIRAQYAAELQGLRTAALRATANGAGAARYITDILDDPETRRIIVDAGQAQRFVDQTDPPPVIGGYRTPFDQCYIEFTDPIVMGESEPGRTPIDRMLAVIIRVEAGTGRLALHFIYHGDDDTWTDRGLGMNANTGAAITRLSTMTDVEPWGAVHASVVPPDFPTGSIWVEARTDGDGIGYWERTIATLAQFTCWLLTYLTAKGIIIVEAAPVSRQVARAMARAKHKPQPWHIVTVQPLRVEDGDLPDGRGGTHGYRYDVRGHLRFGKHRRGDGTYSTTVEWIRPHQRGLQHTMYVPKTYHYKGRGDTPDA